MATSRLVDGDTSMSMGMNSLFDPAQLDPGFYAQSMNMLNRGGILQCRPGYRCLFLMPQGKIQACILFTPKQSPSQIVFVIDGRIYVSDVPFTDFRLLTNVLLSETADRVHHVQAERSVQRNEDGSLTIIPPETLLILQDGVSPAVTWDGSTSEHQRNTNPLQNTKIPIGTAMQWVGDRLWVARDSKLFASDIADPLSFTEDTYLGGSPFFLVNDRITALAITPSLEVQQLLAFTETETVLFQANIRERDTWITTPNFQRTILPNIGCIAPKSIVAHYGLLWWFSNFGLTSFNAAGLSQQSSRLPYTDNEMSISKGFLAGDLSGICTAAFENYLMVSVPYSDPFNKHTWVLDNSVIETLNSSSPSVWNTYWTGTRPVEWATGRVQGVERIFYASADYDGNNRLWAAFQDLRLDDGCPITWTMETRGYYARLPLQDKEFRMADVFLSELEGVVDIDILAAPSSRGLYVSIGKKRIRAMKGSIRYDRLIRFDENIFALKKQSRKIRTQDFRQMPDVNKLSSCGVESESKETIDESFQLFIVGSGEGAVRGLRLFFDPVNDILNGQCQEEEEEERGVRFDGAALKGSSDEIIETLEVPSEVFTSTKTFAAEIKGVSAVGTGEGISTISQEDADKIAQCIAESKVAHDLERTAPVTLGGLDV